jgi:hypothetical protein
VPDLFRALMLYVPEPVLARLATDQGIDATGERKRAIAKALAEQADELALWGVVRGFVRTGRSVVTWYLPQRPVAELTPDSVQKRLVDHYDQNPFEDDLTFNLTLIPEVVSAMWLSDDVALLELARIKEAAAWDGLDFAPRAVTAFSRAVLRMGTTFLECWGDFQTARATGGRLGLILGLGNTQQVVLDDAELDQLTSRLRARIPLARVKDDSGTYDTIEVVADPIVRDLQQIAAYRSDIAGKPSIRRVIEFDPPAGGSAVRLEITRSSGFWFRGFVGEDMVEHVLSIIRAIKGF